MPSGTPGNALERENENVKKYFMRNFLISLRDLFFCAEFLK
jgi:hypothetical protein